MKFGRKIPKHLGKIATKPQGGFFYSHCRLKILETNCMNKEPNTFAHRGRKATYLLPWQHGEILRRLEGGWGKSGNISETRKNRGKVTMDGL